MLKGLILCNAMDNYGLLTLQYNRKSPAGHLVAESSQVALMLHNK